MRKQTITAAKEVVKPTSDCRKYKLNRVPEFFHDVVSPLKKLLAHFFSATSLTLLQIYTSIPSSEWTSLVPSSMLSSNTEGFIMNALENVYNIGYLDGRNHVLALIVLWSKKKKPETILHTLSNKM